MRKLSGNIVIAWNETKALGPEVKHRLQNFVQELRKAGIETFTSAQLSLDGTIVDLAKEDTFAGSPTAAS